MCTYFIIESYYNFISCFQRFQYKASYVCCFGFEYYGGRRVWWRKLLCSWKPGSRKMNSCVGQDMPLKTISSDPPLSREGDNSINDQSIVHQFIDELKALTIQSLPKTIPVRWQPSLWHVRLKGTFQVQTTSGVLVNMFKR
jgi:hypothetical protein